MHMFLVGQTLQMTELFPFVICAVAQFQYLRWHLFSHTKWYYGSPHKFKAKWYYGLQYKFKFYSSSNKKWIEWWQNYVIKHFSVAHVYSSLSTIAKSKKKLWKWFLGKTWLEQIWRNLFLYLSHLVKIFIHFAVEIWIWLWSITPRFWWDIM